MKVIVREKTRIGYETEIDVFRYDDDKKGYDQLKIIADADVEWLTSDGIEVIEEEEIYDDEAYVYCNDYAIHYYVCEVMNYYMP